MESRIVIRDAHYWAVDEDLKLASARFKRLSGKNPSKKAQINALYGLPEHLDEITVNEVGTLLFSKKLIHIKVQ